MDSTHTKEIYLDNAATTPIRDEVLNEMIPYFTHNYGNPSSLYEIAQVARNAVDMSREQIAKILNCKPSEIVFTSGGTESDNMAIIGVGRALSDKGNHLITTEIEHHAVIHSMEAMENQGFNVDYVGVDRQGIINLDELSSKINSETILVSIMFVNNEIGTIQNLQEISNLVNDKARGLDKKIFLHTDAVQAAGKLDLDVEALGVDIMSLSAHKFGGPKGVGCLYVKKGTPISPIIFGGGQERQRRSGTENVPGIVGFSKAFSMAESERGIFNSHCEKLKQKFMTEIKNIGHEVIISSSKNHAVSNVVNVCFPGFEGEPILIGLDMAGICASSGSACSSASLDPSHVLVAIGIDPKVAVGSVRFSFSLSNTMNDVTYAIERLSSILDDLKLMAQA
ncbi:MAG: cysteine desulfurase family protein [Chloroflexota bacterium]